MTPKEKAEDILDKCYGVEVESVYFGVNHYLAKKFALIVVDEVQQLIKDLSSCKNRFIYIIDEMNYWQEVKQEIENIDAEYKKADKEAFNLINKKTKL
jgi:hypothetical protein